MELNIKKACLSPFSENKWYIKLIFPVIMSAFGLVSNPHLHISNKVILLTLFISMLPNIVFGGLYTQFQHNEIHNKTPLLPCLDGKVKNYFIYGLNGLGITLIYMLIGLLLFIYIPNLFKNTGIISVVISLFSLLGIIAGIIIWLFALNAYADYFCFKDAIDLGRIFKLISKVQLLEFFGFIFIAILIVNGINLVSTLTNIILVVSPIIIVIMQLILMNIMAQLYKIAKKRLEKK